MPSETTDGRSRIKGSEELVGLLSRVPPSAEPYSDSGAFCANVFFRVLFQLLAPFPFCFDFDYLDEENFLRWSAKSCFGGTSLIDRSAKAARPSSCGGVDDAFYVEVSVH